MENLSPLRWVRSGVGGGLLGLLVSTSFFWSDAGSQLKWMALAISSGIGLGLYLEWRSPWANGNDDSDPLDDCEPDEPPNEEEEEEDEDEGEADNWRTR